MIEQGDTRLLDHPVAERQPHLSEPAQRRYYGDEQAQANLAPRPATVSIGRMLQRPSRVAVINVQTRSPRPMIDALG